MTKIKKPKLKVEQIDIFNKHDKRFKEFCEDQTKSTLLAAKNDARNPPKVDVQIKHLPEVKKIGFACSTKIAEIAKSEKGTLDNTLTDFIRADNKLKNSQSDESRIAELTTNKKKATEKAEQNCVKKDAILEENENEVRIDLKNMRLDLQNMIKHSLLWPCLAVIVLGGFICSGDIVYVARAFELTGLSYFEKYMVAIGVGLSTIFIGVAIIEILRSKWNSVWKVIGTISCLLLICGVYLVIGKFRADLLEKEMASGVEFSNLSAFDFLLINLIFFVSIALIHWLIWPSKTKFRENREYKNTQKQIIQSERELKSIQKERLNLPNNLIKEQAAISEKFDKEVAEIKTAYLNLELERAENQTIFNNVYGRLLELYDEINFFYKKTVGLYLSTMNKYRNDGVFMTMDEPLDDLPNPFKNFKYLDDDNSDDMGTSGKNYPDVSLDLGK